ncbi:LysR family transcriptional regulator [Streptomyces hainanensis]|uniref:LysR family transcriptional regulator n=1 Tax=Streptomyces hainanensis TaxID=402648 RepID=A0A4R4SHE1_9ACTN|nr:LysR family transcriptional regulator [Streptomyces hainanensis]TDC62890.1 LysR family transcriptional regulator [Streptomyces hainanensis]
MSSPRNENDTGVTPVTPGGADLSPDSWAALLTPRLAQFAAVARHEHVTQAARGLAVPQSTLSRAMARLEGDLGVTLLARHGRRVTLTPAGRAFARSVERALGEVERAAEAVRTDADPAAGKVAFGFLHTMGPETVPALIREFREDHPRVRFSLVQSYGEDMIERMRAGELDLCLTSPVPEAPDLVTRRLDEQRLHLVVPAGHRLAGRRRVRLAEAADEPFVTLEPGYGLRRLTDELCERAGFRPRVAFEGEEPETLRGLVAAGLGVALLPPPTVARPGVVELSVTAPRAARQIGVAWLAGHPDTRPVADFKRFLLGHRGRLVSGQAANET